MRNPPRIPQAPAFLATFLLIGCGAGEPGERGYPGGSQWRVEVDTLPGGAEHVINTPPHADAPDPAEWRLEVDLRIGQFDGIGPDVFEVVRSLGVDPEGNMYIIDTGAGEVRAFGPDGGHLWTAGGRGAGPGELSERAVGLALAPDGSIWVPDHGNQRYAVFEADGRHRTDYPAEIRVFGVMWNGGFDREGRLHDLDSAPGEGIRLVRFGPEREAEAVFELPEASAGSYYRVDSERGSRFVGIPFGGRSTWTIDPRGYIWFAGTNRYTLYQRRMEGDTVRVIEVRRAPVPVTAAERDSAIASVREGYEAGGFSAADLDWDLIPEHKPWLERIDVDDRGRLWVRRLRTADDPGSVFDVLDPDGRLIATARADFHVPGSLPAVVVRDDAVYAVMRDEFDVSYVVRARIVEEAADGE